MRIKYRWYLCIIFLLTFLLFPPPPDVYAEEINSGPCGDNASWTYDAATQTVTISGTGAISDYDGTDPRWERYYSNIQRVVIGEGITHICANAFLDDVKIKDIAFLGDMPTFGDNCFAHISASAWYPKDNSTWVFPVKGNHGATDLFFQKSGMEATHCGDNATWQYDPTTATLTISGNGPMYEFYDEQRQPWASFREQVQYVVIGEGITHIGRNAFSYMTGLKNIRCLGNMPTFSFNTVVDVTVSGSYPDGNPTWDLTKPQKGSTNGGITWSYHIGTSGKCGGNTTWHYDPATATLTIAGSGNMNAYEQWENPWRFYFQDIKTIIVKGTVNLIADGSFDRCFNATQIIIEDGVTSIGWGALSNTKISSIDLPDSVEFIGNGVLNSSLNLTSLKLPPNLKTVSQFIVTNCRALKTIYVGEKVTEVQEGGFANLEHSNIYFTGDAPAFHPESFRYADATVYYPKDNTTWTEEVKQQYAGTLRWVAYDPNNPDSTVPPTVPGFTVPPDVTGPVAGDGWFYQPHDGLLYLAGWCNQDAQRDAINTWRESATRIVVDDGAVAIADDLFNGFTSLTEIVLADSISHIGNLAFPGCQKITEQVLPSSLISIGNTAFADWISLERISFPGNLEKIGEDAFISCISLTEIIFNGPAPEIAENAFWDVTAIVYYPADDPSWEALIGKDFGGTLTWVRQGDTPPEIEPPADLEQLINEIQNAQDGSSIEITETVISQEVLETAKDKNIDLVLDMVEYQWTIPGDQIIGLELSTIDMEVTLDTHNIPDETIGALTGSADFFVQLSLAHSGDFGFAAKLTVPVVEGYAGQTGSLYFYNENQELEFIDSGVVGDDNRIVLEFTHASDYLIVIGEISTQPAAPSAWLIPAAACAVSVVIATVFLIFKKRKG